MRNPWYTIRFIAGFAFGVMTAAGAINALTACKPAVAIVDATACVLEGALNGDSLVAIAEKCGVKVEEAVTTLLASQAPAVHATPAYADARRARDAFAHEALCGGLVAPVEGYDAGTGGGGK